MNRQFRVVDLTYMAVCAALIAICAWITVPAAVPFTLQTFAVFCVLGLLGGKRGTVAILVYILLGAVGLPVFSGFNGGIGALLGTTGGYILGFIFIGLIYWAAEKLFGFKLAVRIAAMILEPPGLFRSTPARAVLSLLGLRLAGVFSLSLSQTW